MVTFLMNKQLSKHIPEYPYEIDEHGDYIPFKKSPTEDMCKHCRDYYKQLYLAGVTKTEFPPRCHGHTLELAKQLKQEDFETEEDYHQAVCSLDPVTWCNTEFGHNPKVWDISERWYQEYQLSCTSVLSILRCGRRVGKSYIAMAEAFFNAYHNSGYKVIIITPYEPQVRRLFEIANELLASSVNLKESVKKNSQTTGNFLIQLHNGSTLRFFTAGAKSGSSSDKIRGQDANMIILDEVALMSDRELDPIIAIVLSDPEVKIIALSTIKGKTGPFYVWSTMKNIGFKEWHIISHESPSYTTHADEMLKAKYSEATYKQEILAEWGEEDNGVFRSIDIEQTLEHYELEECTRKVSNKYVLGVDWNKTYGGHIVVVELDQNEMLRLVDKEVVLSDEFTQLGTVQAVIRKAEKWDVDYIYADAGYGQCVGPDTLIQKIDGCVKISQIQVGDKVLTGSGQFKQVLNKVTTGPKTAYRIKPLKCLETTVSEEHPFLTFRAEERFNTENVNEAALQWRNCTEIDPNTDFIAIPKSKLTNKKSSIVDLVDFIDMSGIAYDESHLWAVYGRDSSPNKFSKASLSVECGCSGATINRARRYQRDHTAKYGPKPVKIAQYLNSKYGDSWVEEKRHKFSRYIDIESRDFQIFLGWYLSEGSSNSRWVEISQAKHHYKKEFEELIDSCKRLFPKVTVNTKNPKGGNEQTRVIVVGKIAGMIAQAFGGKYSNGKRIHPYLLSFDLKHLLRGIYYGGGHFVGNVPGLQLSLTSFDLIMQIRQYFIDQGLLPSLYRVKKRKKHYKNQLRLDLGGDQYTIRKISNILGLSLPNKNRVNRRKYLESKNYFYVPISKFEKLGTREGLIDIEVEDDHSFCGNGVILHNTQIELLKQHGLSTGNSLFTERLKPIVMKSNIEVRDPVTNKVEPKPVKHFMVNMAARNVEEHRVILPLSEDTQALSTDGKGVGIVQQMREFLIEKYSSSGAPIYSQGYEHTLTAWMLALLGFTMEYSRVAKVNMDSRVLHKGPKAEDTKSPTQFFNTSRVQHISIDKTTVDGNLPLNENARKYARERLGGQGPRDLRRRGANYFRPRRSSF